MPIPRRTGTSTNSPKSWSISNTTSSFIDDPRDHGWVVVHGHTISTNVEEMPNRIGIDTGGTFTDIVAKRSDAMTTCAHLLKNLLPAREIPLTV